MAKIVVLGGGFGGVVAAESLAKKLGDEHQITVVSRSHRFVFYPALVRFAFGEAEASEISYDLRESLLDRRVKFLEAEVARIDPDSQRIIVAHGEVAGDLNYDYLVFALGRRLATEKITGFFEYAHHLMNVEDALKFGEAVENFREGRAVIGQCPGARLPVPVYETAFALARFLEAKKRTGATRITIVSPEPPGLAFGDKKFATALRTALEAHAIEYLPDFPIRQISPGTVVTENGHAINYSLLMLLPPFRGSSAANGLGISDAEGYLQVDPTMRVQGVEHVYAVGDCVSFAGPKLGHMAVHQGEVAAANLASEIEGGSAVATYKHEMMLVIDEGGGDSIFLHKGLWDDQPGSVHQGRFWTWAKRIHKRYWELSHS